jgi:magnesium transporter
MVLFSEMFASELLNDPVVDKLQEPLGRVKDIIITLGEAFPKVAGLLIELPEQRKEAVLLIGEIDHVGKQFIMTSGVKGRVPFGKVLDGDILLFRDIIDKQIVDVDGARVIRVNDLKLAKVNQDVRLIAADVGMGGLLRRIGLERPVSWFLGVFRKKIRESLIGWDHMEQLKSDLSKGRITIPHKRIEELHPADIAHIISQVHTEEKTALFSSLSERAAAEALHELEPVVGALLISTIDTKRALGILEKMPPDEVADIIGDLPTEKAEELLRLIRPRRSAEIRKLLKHQDETAGGLMTTEFIAFNQNLTVEQTIARLRETAPEAETIYYLYVVDDAGHLTGILTLRRLIISLPEKLISEIMIRDVLAIPPEMNCREVANFISKYNLLAVPVVDPERNILGIVTVDDVMDYILPPISRRKRQMLG